MQELEVPGFRSVPKSGVIYVMDRAKELGYDPKDPSWANLGRGAPEVSTIEGAPERVTDLETPEYANHYGAVLGVTELRQKVADLYNRTYRQGKKSQYTYENVAICNGGRLALTRLAAILGDINLGHFIPDYTAYEELLDTFRAFNPIPILGNPHAEFHIPSGQLREEILGRGLSAILLSNPCNPTGQVLMGDGLGEWVRIARELSCSIIFDEFYSHYIFDSEDTHDGMSSSAAYIDDVDKDPVIIVDGLTKNWRYPGWRISWTLGPKEVIETLGSAGSFIDGGPTHPLQYRALELLDYEDVVAETKAIQRLFREKRDFVINEVKEMGITVDHEPIGTFYVWANLSKLPGPLNDATKFFEEGLKEKFITVPGIFFDVNPGKRRSNARYQSYCRISFGPNMEELKTGLASMKRLIEKFQ